MDLSAINKRLAELRSLLEASTDANEIKTLGDEVADLIEKRGRLLGVEAQRAREDAMRAFDNKGAVEAPKAAAVTPMSKRHATALLMGLALRKKTPDETQKRALDVSLTTTATTYVAATASVNGVNNAGVLIPTVLVYDLLREEGKLSPILADILMSRVPGLVTFPYRKSRTAANVKGEGLKTADNQFELASLDLRKGWLQIVIQVTEEVMLLSDIDLGEYVVSNMLADLNEDWASEFIYGTGVTGTLGRISGITIGALSTGIAAYEDINAAIETGIKLLTGKHRRGAKIYVAQDAYDAIAFSKDSEGRYLFPVFNNKTGVQSFSSYDVLLDENLKPGDFVIAAVGRNYKVNILKDISIEHDKEINAQIHTYVASGFFAAAPVPGTVVYGKKKVG